MSNEHAARFSITQAAKSNLCLKEALLAFSCAKTEDDFREMHRAVNECVSLDYPVFEDAKKLLHDLLDKIKDGGDAYCSPGKVKAEVSV